MKYMYDFYSDPMNQEAGSDLRYIQLLLILAFGKALVENNYQAKKPPGAEYFARALRLLPSTHALVQESILSTEVLCCIALYFQCLDYRHSAHNFVSPAFLRRMKLLTMVPDWSSYTNCSLTGDAHRYASPTFRRSPGRTESKGLVDYLCSGPRNDLFDGLTPVHQRRRCASFATTLFGL